MAADDHNELGQRWLGKLTRLNPASGRATCRGKAPHKPLLLLSLLDMAESGDIRSRAFTRSPALVLRFRTYGCIVADRWPNRLDIKMPLFYMRNQQLWDAYDSEMRPATAPENCVLCEMNPELFELLADPGFRLKARMVLISRYFEPAERVALFESMGLQVDDRLRKTAEHEMGVAVEAAKQKGRSARFAVRIVSEYRFTCALTGYQCMADGASIVDAAHIEAWAQTQNDDLTNGLALSKNAHWMFDEGLWSADNQLRVVVAKNSSAKGDQKQCNCAQCQGDTCSSIQARSFAQAMNSCVSIVAITDLSSEHENSAAAGRKAKIGACLCRANVVDATTAVAGSRGARY